MNKQTMTIYALVDIAAPDHYRYVGQAKNIETRMQSHRTDTANSLKTQWLKDINYEFTYEVLEMCVPERARERERRWIILLIKQGNHLTNELL